MSNAEPIVVKSGDLNNLLQGLQALDGFQEAVGSQVITRPYKIKGAVRIRLGKWLTSVSEAIKVVNEARTVILKSYCAGKGESGKDLERVPPDKILAFNDDMQAAMEEPHSFAHAKIPVKDILGDNDENTIPISVLTALSPILAD